MVDTTLSAMRRYAESECCIVEGTAEYREIVARLSMRYLRRLMMVTGKSKHSVTMEDVSECVKTAMRTMNEGDSMMDDILAYGGR